MNQVVCAGLREDIEMPRDKERIPELWSRLQSRIPEIKNICGPAMGVVSGSAKSGCVNYAACVQVADTNSLPENLDIITVPAGNYAEFVHEGPVSELFGTCDQIYRILVSGLGPSDGRWTDGGGLSGKLQRATNQIPGSGSWFRLKIDLRKRGAGARAISSGTTKSSRVVWMSGRRNKLLGV